jgi:uroporphyrin-III C-methyltransferase
MRRGSFVAVGVGIGGVGQTTLEAAALIRRAERLFYCVVDGAVELWLRECNPRAASLAPLYQEGRDRGETYADMSKAFVTAVREGHSTCAVFYGHPGVLVEATHATIRQLRVEGYPARMVPAVSADGCLYADLLLNPGDRGLQSHETSRFVYNDRDWDPHTPLILWQVGVFGRTDWTARPQPDPARLSDVRARLLTRYPETHGVILYYAATSPMMGPNIRHVALKDLPDTHVYPMDLLVVPPLAQEAK